MEPVVVAVAVVFGLSDSMKPIERQLSMCLSMSASLMPSNTFEHTGHCMFFSQPSQSRKRIDVLTSAQPVNTPHSGHTLPAIKQQVLLLTLS